MIQFRRFAQPTRDSACPIPIKICGLKRTTTSPGRPIFAQTFFLIYQLKKLEMEAWTGSESETEAFGRLSSSPARAGCHSVPKETILRDESQGACSSWQPN